MHSRSTSEVQLLELHVNPATPIDIETFPPLEQSVFSELEQQFLEETTKALALLDSTSTSPKSINNLSPASNSISKFDVPLTPEQQFFDRDTLYASTSYTTTTFPTYSRTSSSTSTSTNSSSTSSDSGYGSPTYGSRYAPPPLCPTPLSVVKKSTSSLANRREGKSRATSINLELLMLGSNSGGIGDGRGIDGKMSGSSRRISDNSLYGGFKISKPIGSGQNSPCDEVEFDTGSSIECLLENGEEDTKRLLLTPGLDSIRRKSISGFHF